MRFTLSVLAVLSASAIAAPGMIARDVLTTSEAADALSFAVAAADCNIGDCITVVASAVCIAAGIAARSPSTVVGCVQGGAGSVSIPNTNFTSMNVY
jgi:hypothetical protein